MILDDATLKQILNERPNKKLIKAAQEYTIKQMMHVKGIKLDEYIQKTEAFEKDDVLTIRKKYAVSNKAMFARVHRPIDKVFSAKGGSQYYNVSGTAEDKLKDKLKEIVMGYSLKQWLEIFWMPAAAYDPMGLVFIEIDADGNPYPTYKSILDIYEIKYSGRGVEYVIFNVDNRPQAQQELTTAAKKQFRVVDDISDRIIELEGEDFKEVPGQTHLNYFMKVPARVISNIYDPVRGMFISYDDDIIELADQFLREGSVKNIFKNYFGYPIKWEYQSACPSCKGEGVLAGRTCADCNGSGVKSKSDPSETIRIPVPKDNTQPKLAPELAGYVTPDIQGWDKMTQELQLLEEIMFQTMWGTQQLQDDKKNQTATGKFIDTQPVNDRLNKFTDAYENMETFCVDMIGFVVIGPAYGGASITEGRRYMIETPDEIWQKLQSARKDGAPTAALYDLYNDYLQARYSANAMELEKMLNLAKIEPLPFAKYEEFGRLQQFPDQILRKKFWFESWVAQKSNAQLLGNVDKLLQDFEAYCEKMELTIQPEPGSPDDPNFQALQQQMMSEQDPEKKKAIQQQMDGLKTKKPPTPTKQAA